MLLNKVLRVILSTLLTLSSFNYAISASNDSIGVVLRELIDQATLFTERMPPEKVSVHLDNTGYFKGDKIWFQCYVVDGITNAPTPLSNTLYVELLSPRGEVIAKQTLKIEDGRCHGAFSLDHLPFYSGFYEIRAYTKYMLNFGDAAVFSRTIPVFEAPKKEGDFSVKKMTRSISRYPGTRPNTKSGPNLSMRFFPEGGSLIVGIPTKVAFEITGRSGMPIEASGIVVDESSGDTIAEIHTLHEGRGYFEITPEMQGDYKAILNSGNVKGEHKFKLPKVRESGVGLSVDNYSNPDSIFITIRPKKESGAADVAGMALSSRGGLWSYSFVSLNNERTLKLSSRNMPSGVSIISIFGHDGQTLAERMIFVNNGGYGKIEATLDKFEDDPKGKLILDISATESNGNPAAMLPLSVSVTDGDDAVDYQGALLSDLLLMSDIKGYVRNPMQYFRSDSDVCARNLDLLMMVSGWRCYSWEEMANVKPINLQYKPENAIDLEGQVVSFVRSHPKANVDVSVMISEVNAPDSLKQIFSDCLTTDSCGRFRISYDLNGKWSLIMSVTENGKKKDHRVILDRLFSPAPRKYERAEMVVDNYVDTNMIITTDIIDNDTINNSDTSIDEYLASSAVKLNEVEVKGKHNREAEIYKARSKALIYYDLQEEISDLIDRGEIVSKDLFEVLKSINPNFHKRYNGSIEKLMYKNKSPLFVIDYERTTEKDALNYTYLYPESIKSIYITEDAGTMLRYADPIKYNLFNIDQKYGCAVLIETFPERRSPVSRGTRYQTIEGYTVPDEFYNIDNDALLENPDLRRTLYWNPAVITDSEGKVGIDFFNNSSCRNIRISIEGIDSNGTIYSY